MFTVLPIPAHGDQDYRPRQRQWQGEPLIYGRFIWIADQLRRERRPWYARSTQPTEHCLGRLAWGAPVGPLRAGCHSSEHYTAWTIDADSRLEHIRQNQCPRQTAARWQARSSTTRMRRATATRCTRVSTARFHRSIPCPSRTKVLLQGPFETQLLAIRTVGHSETCVPT